MPVERGRRVRLSPARKLITDLMGVFREVPTVTAERTLALADLVARRRRMASPPAWTALFAKAFARVAADIPALRRSYIRYPWPHLYEHSQAVAVVAVEREYRGEEVVLFVHLRGLVGRSLQDLDRQLRHSLSAPLDRVGTFRRSLRLARFPWPLRGWLMRLGLHGSGRLREKHFGTFVVSSPAAQGAGLLHLISGTTAAVHYGLFDAAGNIDVRLTFDHRVLDGATAARALSRMEAVLNGEVLEEHGGSAAPVRSAG
jgi:hypothetical protein